MAKLGWLMIWVGVIAPGWGSVQAQAVVPAAPSAPAAASQAVSPAVRAMVDAAIAKLSVTAHVDWVQPAPLPGFYQVIASGRMLYVSADGRYVMNGDLFDLTSMHNASESAWAKYRQQALAKVPASARIVFAPVHPRYTISVFTDVNCSFCRELHKHVAAFNAAGIAVEYLAWPREGVTTTAGAPTSTYTKMVSVWCAKDRRAAFTAATADRHVAPATCANPVKEQFDLGLQLGVEGTPSVIGPDGYLLGGYLTPEQLLAALKQRG